MKAYFKKVIVKILELEARAVLWRYKPKIVAVTGNVGKTSTKDAVYTALSQFFFVRKSEKSFNSDVGVPLTILGLPNAWNNPVMWIQNILKGLQLIVYSPAYPKWLVLEVGADRPGDIQKISTWLHPDVVVVTRFSAVPVHVEFFGSKDEVVKEKGYLVKALKKDGFLVLNADDADVMSYAKESFIKPLTYGSLAPATVRGSEFHLVYEGGNVSGITFKVDYQGNCMPVSVGGILGSHHMYPVLGAFAVAMSQGLNPVKVGQALASYVPPRGRMNIIKGKNGSILIDDSYNSSPIALEEALNTLEMAVCTGKKIAILGDMLELGKFSIEEHKRLGKKLAKICDTLVTVGIRGKFFAEGALKARMGKRKVVSFETSIEAGDFIQNKVEKGDLILIKGSQGVRMEKVTKILLGEPERAQELLVRQDEEWSKR
ncbi:MAG: hypothetical protein RJA61_613 [Candidatus Parcubacteria bacterium]|jgi:UDP-N-acetylmuramoyl-tripeptide--D-alanyl-D-alanine ligase